LNFVVTLTLPSPPVQDKKKGFEIIGAYLLIQALVPRLFNRCSAGATAFKVPPSLMVGALNRPRFDGTSIP
jgi:hypothetical protein